MGSQLIPVSDNIWCVRRLSYFTCSYIVKVGDGVVLIDAGMDSGGRDMLDALKKLAFEPTQIKAILLTHWHNDHAAGGKVLQALSGADTYYHKAEEAFLTRKTAHSGLRGFIADAIPELGPLVLFKGLIGEASPQAVEATHFVEDGQMILDEFEVIATPGHTDGHVSFYYGRQKALFAGDALAVINGQARFMSRPVTPDKERARESMVRSLNRDIELLCPGHREALTRNTQAQCNQLRAYAAAGKHWPLFG